MIGRQLSLRRLQLSERLSELLVLLMEELGFREIQITYRAPIDAFDGD